jgi:hypothetical protein
MALDATDTFAQAGQVQVEHQLWGKILATQRIFFPFHFNVV